MTLLDGKPLDDGPGPSRPMWDALLRACEVDGARVTRSARGAYNRSVADLVQMRVDPDEVAGHAKVFRQRWPDVSLTPTALVRRWAETVPPKQKAAAMGAPVVRRAVSCPKCDQGWIDRDDGTVVRCQH